VRRFGIAAFGGRIRRRAASCPPDPARNYLREVAPADLGGGPVGVLVAARGRLRGDVRPFSSFHGHPPLGLTVPRQASVLVRGLQIPADDTPVRAMSQIQHEATALLKSIIALCRATCHRYLKVHRLARLNKWEGGHSDA
jgi:hypothetical protein